MNKYAELRQRQQQEVNALPIGFAFGNRQFEEMMRGWGLDPEKDLDKIYRLGRTGGYYKKTDAQLIHDTFSRHDAELQAAIAEDKTGEGFIYEMFLCELDNHEGYYTLDLAKFEKEIADNDVKMFILCSPHNPVSRVWTEEELAGMFDICKKHGVLVLSDEIHQDFAYGDHKFISSSIVKGGAYKDILILLNAGSKTFNLAGLIHSHVIIFNEDLMKTYDEYIKSIGCPEANVMGLTALEAAYRGGAEWLENVKALICHNYEYMVKEFAEKCPKIVVTPLEGTYLSWIDLRGYMPGDQVADFIQKKCRLACDVGEWFSFTGHGFVRFNLATDTKNIKTAVERVIQNIQA